MVNHHSKRLRIFADLGHRVITTC